MKIVEVEQQDTRTSAKAAQTTASHPTVEPK
jgi:hypothetical protein